MADLTHLDGKTLKAFAEHDITDFQTALDKIRKDDPNGLKALKSILDGRTTPGTLQQDPALAIGLMGTDDSVHGQSLVAAVKKAAGSVDEIFESQQTLFKHIKSDLLTTIEKLLSTQGKSLESIDGAALLDIFSDVDKELSPTTKTGA
ncbi:MULTISPECIES: type VII secretion system-associated protein [unclassified Streptomyces]|uniref:type VII secretion system-associated protein n=1 Tax=unclassified Streptomyces TaxID=2593676 RepID=UPI003647B29D